MNKSIPLTGLQSWSLRDIAQTLVNLSGKKVEYTPISRREFVFALMNRGLPEVIANRYADFQAEIHDGLLDWGHRRSTQHFRTHACIIGARTEGGF